jgi:spermidine synthase
MRGTAVTNRNATIYHTLKSVFRHVLPAGERFLFFFASNDAGRISADVGTLQSRYLERNIETEGFSPRQFEMLLQEGPLRRINWIIRHHGRSRDVHLTGPDTGPLFPPSIVEQEIEESRLPPVERRTFINSDFRPIAYYYTLVFWNALTRGSRGRLHVDRTRKGLVDPARGPYVFVDGVIHAMDGAPHRDSG